MYSAADSWKWYLVFHIPTNVRAQPVLISPPAALNPTQSMVPHGSPTSHGRSVTVAVHLPSAAAPFGSLTMPLHVPAGTGGTVGEGVGTGVTAGADVAVGAIVGVRVADRTHGRLAPRAGRDHEDGPSEQECAPALPHCMRLRRYGPR